MILRRIGNKQRIASEIIPYFLKHKIYIEPFFGAGGMFFNKPRSMYSIVNDLDSDVFNLFQVIKNDLDQFIELFSITPMSEELFYYWIDNEEIFPIHKALRFLFISSFSYLGKNDTMRLLHSETSYKTKLETLIKKSANFLKSTLIRNKDFRLFFDGIQDSDYHIGKSDRFIYADSPYLGTENNYSTPKWNESDSLDLFDVLENENIRFAMSEFSHPFIVDQVKKRKLNLITIGERVNLKNRKIEILITNFKDSQGNLFTP